MLNAVLVKKALTILAGVAVGTSLASCSHVVDSPERTVVSPPTVTSVHASDPNWRVAGLSVQGRPIRTLTLGRGPRKVLFIGGIHGDEPEGAYTTAELAPSFSSAGIDGDVTLTIIEDLNPDGRSASTRFNANGVDINRNFPASNFDRSEPTFGGAPLTQPESRILFQLINEINPSLVLVMHSWVGKQFINFDGPAGDIAARFSAESGMPLTPSTEFAPTPGSLGSYFGRDRHTPVITIELLKGSDPKLDWARIRTAVLNAIAG